MNEQTCKNPVPTELVLLVPVHRVTIQFYNLTTSALRLYLLMKFFVVLLNNLFSALKL